MSDVRPLSAEEREQIRDLAERYPQWRAFSSVQVLGLFACCDALEAERDAAREALDAAICWDVDGEPRYVTAGGTPQTVPDPVRVVLRKVRCSRERQG